MNNIIYAFILTSLAGFSTMLGNLIIFFKIKKTDKIILSSLSFAAGVMLTVSITDLIPESILLLKENLTEISTIIICLFAMVLGIIISMLIDYYLPDDFEKSSNNKPLYKVGLVSMIAIILHNIPEGIATFLASNKNISLGISLTIAIAMHNIPEGISISVPIYYSTKSKKKAILYTLISALSEPFGALIALLFLKKIINNLILGIIFSIIAGIMTHISLCELIPAAKKYNNKNLLYISFVIGTIFMLLKFII